MSDFRQAPKLYHSGQKDKKDFYLLPKNLMDPIFNQLNGKQGNQIKLMAVLLGTAGDGRFAVSEKWICDRTGMDQSNYNRARKALIDRGWLRLENGGRYVDFHAICSSADYAGAMSSEKGTCDESMEKACVDNMYNKELKNKNNIIKSYSESFPETGKQRKSDHVPIPERIMGDREEEHKKEFEWIDLEIQYEEEVRRNAAKRKEKRQEKARRDDPVAFGGLFGGLFEPDESGSYFEEESYGIGLEDESEEDMLREEYLL